MVFFFPLVSPSKIFVEHIEDKVFLHCNASVMWLEGTVGTELEVNKYLDLGKRILDPRGMYVCNGTAKKMPSMQIYFRSMCLLDPLSWNGGPLK